MDVAGASRAAGARLTIWECLNGAGSSAPQQQFLWYSTTGEIKVYDGTSDVKCVDDSGGYMQPGDNVVIWTCHGGAPQKWEPTPDGTGIRLQGTNLCIDVPNGDPTLGTGLILWTCWGGVPQQWDARPLGGPTGNMAAPIVSTASHNGDNRNLALCGATCFELTASYTTPAYVSMDQPKSVSLVYMGRQALKTALVQVDAEDRSTTPPDRMSLKLQRPDGSWVVYPNGTSEVFFRGATGKNRLSVRVDDSAFNTGAYHFTAVVTSYWDGAGVQQSSSTPIRVLAVNQDASPYGWGWSVAGIQRIGLLNPSPNDSMYAWDGTGSVQFFRNGGCDGSGACTWLPPDGEFSTIRYNPNGAATGSEFTAPYARFWPDGSVAGYDAYGKVRFTRDRLGNETRFVWQDGERIQSITDPANKTTNFGYDGAGKLRTITDPGLRVTTVTIDGNGDLVSIVDPGQRTVFRASYQGHILAVTWDARNSQTNYASDLLTRMGIVTLPTVRADGVDKRPTVTAQMGETAGLINWWDGTGRGTAGNPSPRVDPDAVRSTLTDARGYTTTFQLDRFGAPLRIEEPLGRTTIIARDQHGRPTRVQSPAGHVATTTYDGSRVTSTHDETTGRTINIAYGSNPYNLPDSVYGDVPVTHYKYNAQWLVDSTWVTGKSAAHYTYDSRGRVSTIGDPEGHPTTILYDPGGWQNTQSVIQGAEQRLTHYEPNSYGLTWRTTTPDGNTSQTEYDVLNRVRRTVNPQTEATVYNYDDPLFLTSVVDAKSQIYRFQRNALGWVDVATDARGRDTRYGYDAAGNVTSTINRRGQTITANYNALGQLESRTADGATTIYRTDPAGRWTSAENAESIDSTFFDVAGRAEQAVTRRPNGARHVIQYISDVRDRLTNVTIGSWSVGYRYDALDQLDTLTDGAGRRTAPWYNQDGQRTYVALPMGVRVQSNFPSLHTISGLTFNFPALDDALGVGYVRDSLGRISTRLNNQANRGRDYAYDDAGRLTEFKDFTIQGGGGTCTPIYASDDPAPGEEPIGYDCPPPESRSYGSPTTFTYDAVGNRTDNGAVLDGNRLTRFGRWTLEYDDDGNLTRKYDATCPSTCERRYSWNSLSQLTGVYTAGAGWVYFGYDGLGRRVRREMESGPKESHVYDGDHLILATDGNGALLGEWAYYPGVDQPHSFRWQGRVYYYQQDGAGNVTGVIADDGTLANRTEYEPFGTLVPGTGAVSGLGFKGREHDPPTGLVYMRARWYDPELGRFISEDPIGLSGGINPYAFAGNDPVNFADPSGLDKCKEGAGPGWTDVYIEDSGWWCYKKDGGQPLPPVPVTASPPNWPNYPPAIPGAPQCATCGGGGGGGTPSGEAEWREQRAAESFDRNRRVVGAFNKWGSCIVDNNLATLEMAGYAAAAVVGVNAVRVYDAGGFAAVGVKSVGGAVGMLTGYTSLTTALELIGGAFVTVPVATGVVGGLVFSQLAVAAYCAIH